MLVRPVSIYRLPAEKHASIRRNSECFRHLIEARAALRQELGLSDDVLAQLQSHGVIDRMDPKA